MTTLVGILAMKNTPAVVLASDLTATLTEWENRGDVTVRQQTKTEVKKIHIDNERNLALCMAGSYDPWYIEFLLNVQEGKIDFKEAMKSENFPALSDLNLKKMGGKKYDYEKQNLLLVASRYENSPRLWTCYPLGRVEERSWTVLGSGEKHASAYIQSKGYLPPRQIDLGTALDLAYGALKSASQDIYTGGWDVTVITPYDIIEYGDKIKKDIQRCEQQTLKEIIENSMTRLPFSRDREPG